MLENNNKKVINRLSKKILKVNKMRNICAILAIILTTLLITITISGGITFYNANNQYKIISRYKVNCDGYFNLNEDSKNKLESIDNIEKIGISKLASIEGIKNKELLNERVNLESVDKTCYDMMSITPIEGEYPKKSNEALVPTWVLDVLDVEKNIGEKIKLDVVINNEIKSIEFILSGYYESLVPRGTGQTSIFVSDEFIKEYNSTILNIKNTRVAYVNLRNLNEKSSLEMVKLEMKSIAQKIGAYDYKVHPKYDKEVSTIPVSENIEQIVAIIVGILIVMITGYLIIYNIFHISVTRDIRFYGLLKTIGTTSKQLKRIIARQAFMLSLIGIPVGIIVGYFISTIIIPMAFTPIVFGSIAVVKFDLYMVIPSIIFSLITVFISCNKPAKQAGKVSPIEAVRYVQTQDVSKKKIKKGAYGAKIYKMAWSNIIKNKKRVILSILSISLSAVTVIFTINATMGMDPKKHAENQMMSDIEIENNTSYSSSGNSYKPIKKEFINDLANLDTIENLDFYYGGITPLEDGDIFSFMTEITIDEKFKKELKSYGSSNAKYRGFSYKTPEEDVIYTSVRALKSEKLDKEVEMLEIVDGEINKEKFATGNYMIYYVRDGEVNTLKSGDKLKLKFTVQDKNGQLEQVEKELEIMALVKYKGQWAPNNLELINIEENAFKEIFPQYENYIQCIHIDLKENTDIKKADEVISKTMIESGNSNLRLISKNFYIEGIKHMKLLFAAIGAIISSIFGLIGIINVMNTILTGIFSRKIEFAMLESIGMTKKQLKEMLIFEGVYYVILTSLLIIPLGVSVGFIAPMMLPIYGGFDIFICIVSIIVSILILSVLLLLMPILGYNMVSKESIVDRLKVIE